MKFPITMLEFMHQFPDDVGCPDFDGGRKLDFAAIIVRGGRDGTKGLPAGVSATCSGSG
jgi:hypothetical protein